MRQFTVFTAYTEHDSKTINTITYTCFNRNFEFIKNLDALVMEESVYSGGGNKF